MDVLYEPHGLHVWHVFDSQGQTGLGKCIDANTLYSYSYALTSIEEA